MSDIRPHGLRPSGHLIASGSFSGKRREYPLSTAGALTAPLVYGQPVTLASTGIVECQLDAGDAADASLQALDTSYVGVFVGCRKADADGRLVDDQIISGTPAAGDVAYVVDDPYVLFDAVTTAQASGGALAPVVGETYAFGVEVNNAAAVNEAGKISLLSIDVSAPVSNGPVRVLEVGDSDADDTNTWWKVKVAWNAGHQLLSTATIV